MERKEYNKSVLRRCIKLLKSRCLDEVYDGIVLAAYLIEQSFKSELRKINPLLYFDRRNISDKTELLLAMGKIPNKEVLRLKTCTATRCISQMCECNSALRQHRANIEELFVMRNFIIHSTDDFSFDKKFAAETAVSALRSCREYITKHVGITSKEFNPLTTDEFEKLQETERGERINDLKGDLNEHKKIFNKLKPLEVTQKILAKLPKTDSTIWIEETGVCPACKQLSFDKIGTVDFDWNPDGMEANGQFYYQCRVCELELSEYEYELVGRNADI